MKPYAGHRRVKILPWYYVRNEGSKTATRTAARLELARGEFARVDTDECTGGICRFCNGEEDGQPEHRDAAEYRSKVQPPPRVLATLADAMRAA